MDHGEMVRRRRSGQAAGPENTRLVRRRPIEGIYSWDSPRCHRPFTRSASRFPFERCLARGDELGPELAMATRWMAVSRPDHWSRRAHQSSGVRFVLFEGFLVSRLRWV